jgi:hypothetical protein
VFGVHRLYFGSGVAGSDTAFAAALGKHVGGHFVVGYFLLIIMSFGLDDLFFVLEHRLIGRIDVLDKELGGPLLLILPLPRFEFFSDKVNKFGLLIEQRTFQDLLI